MKQSPIEILAHVARGYATDAQCEAALKREQTIVCLLSDAHRAMLAMRAMLGKHDIATKGGTIDATIKAVHATVNH